MKPNGKYVSNDESNVHTKFREQHNNFILTKAFNTMGGAMGPLWTQSLYILTVFTCCDVCAKFFEFLTKDVKNAFKG